MRYNPKSTQWMVVWRLCRTYSSSVWQHPNGNRNVAYLDNWNAKRNLNLNWIENDWNEHCRFVAVRNFLYSPASAGVSFAHCFIHVPIILPTSVNSGESAINFWWVIIFISQASWRKYLSSSSVILAFCTISSLIVRFAYPARSKWVIRLVKSVSIFAPRVWRERRGR